jgi:hypothetical protein
MCPSGRYTTYGDSYFSSLDNKLQYEPLHLSCHSHGPNEICQVLQILNAAPIAMLSGHHKCSNFHVQWLRLEESYAEAHVFIQVLCAQFVANTKG